MKRNIRSKLALSKELGVHRHTVDAWQTKGILPDGPPWSLEEVKQAVEAEAERKAAEKPSDDLKEEKLRLECERLVVSIKREKEFLKQAQIETARTEGKLVDRAEEERRFMAEWQRARKAVEDWRTHQTAKHPADVDRINELADGFCQAVHDA